MGYKIGLVSQKGGVGKSTLARSLAVAYAAEGWDVKIADLDINQGTSFDWLQRRLKEHIKPEIRVEIFGSPSAAIKHANNHDLLLFDGAPHANKATVDIAKYSDLIVLPVGLSLDDLIPSHKLARDLHSKHGIDRQKIAFALCRVGQSDAEIKEASEWLMQTGITLLDGMMPEKVLFRRAHDTGRSAIEVSHRALREQADNLIQSIMTRLETLVLEKEKHGENRTEA